MFHALPATATAQVRADVYISGLTAPVAFVQDPTTAAVQFVVEQGGRIRVVRNGVLQSDQTFSICTAAIARGGERGLLGLAFCARLRDQRPVLRQLHQSAPATPSSRDSGGRRESAASPIRRRASICRWRAAAGDSSRSRSRITTAAHLAFGPDGFLYIGLGDGGSGDDPGSPRAESGRAARQDAAHRRQRAGRRIRPGYDVPADNPFVSGAPVRRWPEIWAFGLRNPWRYSFDDPARGGTGALVIGDVGQNAWEEIDYEPAGRGGRNYGWRNREGAHDNVTVAAARLSAARPIRSSNTATASAQSITGGFVYRGSALGGRRIAGRYFFADFVSGRVWSLALTVDPATGEARRPD